MKTQKTAVIIDCDTGIDDAMALVLACSSKALDIVGITTVAGNVDCDNTTRNTCNLLHLLGRDDIRVARGADGPLERKSLKASGVHGVSGLRGYTFAEDYTASLVKDMKAWDFQRKLLMESETKITIIAIGPVTNLAILLETYPEVKAKIEKIVFMGTAYHTGNPTPIATFNVLVDPEAFRKVIFGGVPFYACPLEVTKTSTIKRAEYEQISGMPGRVADFVTKIMTNYGLAGIQADEVFSEEGEEVITQARIEQAKRGDIDMHDPATVAYVIQPELFTKGLYYCDVECKGELTTGFTLIDKADYYGKKDSERNLHLLESIDRDGFVSLFIEAIRAYGF